MLFRSARTSVWPLSISLAATLEIDVSFSSSGYLDVSVHQVPFHTLCIGVWMTGVCPARFPHSDIHGSKIICISPWLFAAYHVFRRLLVPRHPPCALSCLTSFCKCEFISRLLCAPNREAISFNRAHPVWNHPSVGYPTASCLKKHFDISIVWFVILGCLD